jgi:hypothetical protein
MAIIGHERYRTVKEKAIQDQKKSQTNAVQNEAGGLKAGRGIDKGNPRPRHSPTVPAFTKLRHRVLVVPAIDLVDQKINRGPFTEGY